jgi:large subunit ribosomal protein L29
MKPSEIREKTKPELEKILNEKKAELCQLRFDISAKQTKNYKKAAQTKKDIARITTIIKDLK